MVTKMNLASLRKRLRSTDIATVRGDEVTQFGCVKLVENVLAPVTRPFRNAAGIAQWRDYSNSELWLYHTGNCKAAQWIQLATTWRKLYGTIDPSSVVNSAYGHIFKADKYGSSQWSRARDLLAGSRDTRRAFVQFLLPQFAESTVDVPCSVIATFTKSKRDHRLPVHEDFGIDVVYFMRSTDILYGLPHDITWAKSLSMRMQMELAKAHGLKSCKLSKKSTVTFVAANLHEYHSHPVTLDAESHTFAVDYVSEMLDFIVFGGGDKGAT